VPTAYVIRYRDRDRFLENGRKTRKAAGSFPPAALDVLEQM